MLSRQEVSTMNTNRLAAASLAALGAASGLPFGLAQLDYAGIVNVFQVDAGDSPHAVIVLAGIGGVLTLCVIATALVGAALCLAGSTAARPLLVAAAIAGFASALMFWLPSGIAIGAAAALAGPDERTRDRALPAL
jgi:hypothetical protein